MKFNKKCGPFFCLTNGTTCGIINKSSGRALPDDTTKKDFEKSFKKGLTRSSKSGIINKLSQGAGSTGWTAAAS